jgi:hypothetical protein
VRRSNKAACRVPGCKATFRRVANWVSIEFIYQVIIGPLTKGQRANLTMRHLN